MNDQPNPSSAPDETTALHTPRLEAVTPRPARILSFRIPAADLLRLPDAAREEACLKLRCLQRLDRARNKQQMAAQLAAGMNGRPGFSAKSLINALSKYNVSGGDWRVIVNKARAPEARDVIDLSARRRFEFLEWARSFFLLNQREKFLPRYRKLMERLELWRRTGRREYAIPGYDSAPENSPGLNHPPGWSPAHLQKLCDGSRFQKRAMSVGRSAASEFRPLVLTTRRHMKAGQVFFFDDNEHDMKVRLLGSQARVMRPLEFSCLDYFSGCFVANVFKPTLYDEETGKKIKLRSVEFIWLAVHWLIDIGWRADTGTRLVAEHGTAKFPKWFQERVTELTRGLVTFDEGAVDRRPSCEGFFKGVARGNFRTKSPLESMFNLVRNETSDLLLFPGQVGMNRDHCPEEDPAREAHEKQIALAELVLSKEAASLLRHDFLEWNQWKQMAFEVYAKINRRGGPGLEWWPHQLEGFVEAGLVATEWRLPAPSMQGGFTDWLDHTALDNLNGEAAAIRELLAADPVRLTRNRKLSPWEVWQRDSVELTRAPLWWLPLILPPDMARPVRVLEDHTVEFQDQTVSPDKLRFLARVTDRDGCETILKPGTECLGYVNQFNAQAIYLCDERGRGLGEAPLSDRVDHGDAEAVAQRSREMRRVEAALLGPVAKAGAELARVREANAQWNAEQLSKYQPAPPETRLSKEQKDLAEMADAILGGNKRKDMDE